jgi:zinc transport system substrate-binding protein
VTKKLCVKPFVLLPLLICMSCAIAVPAGCDRSTNQTPSAPAKLRVLATVYPLADIARRVAGEHADVQWLVESGQSLDALSSTGVMDLAAQSRVVLSSGTSEDWSPKGMSLDARSVRMVQPETMVAARQLYGGVPPDPNAHLWLDPGTVLDCVESLRQRLAAADPVHEPDYSKNAAGVRKIVEALDAELAAGTKRLRSRRVLIVRPTWGAFCRRYGLEQVAPVQSREERLSDDDYHALSTAAKESGFSCIFVDVTTPAPVRQQIAERLKLRVLTLDVLGTSAPEGRSTYDKIMRYNLEQLTEGLGQGAPKKGAE